MLRSLKDLERYNVSATDGDIGSVVNFLLDDRYANAAINREYEIRLHDYYGRPAYWAEGARPEEAELAPHSEGPRRFSS